MRETDGGNYHPDLAENCYLHLREVPHVEICNGHDEFVRTPTKRRSAIVSAAVVLTVIACAAAAVWHGVIQ